MGVKKPKVQKPQKPKHPFRVWAYHSLRGEGDMYDHYPDLKVAVEVADKLAKDGRWNRVEVHDPGGAVLHVGQAGPTQGLLF